MIIAPTAAVAGFYQEECFPITMEVNRLLSVGELASRVTIEELSTCEGVSSRSAVPVTATGTTDEYKLRSLVSEFNAGSGIDYALRPQVRGGWAIVPADASLSVSRTPVSASIERGKLGEVEASVFAQFSRNTGMFLAHGWGIWPKLRYERTVTVSLVDVPFDEAMIAIDVAAFETPPLRWSLKVWPEKRSCSFQVLAASPHDPDRRVPPRGVGWGDPMLPPVVQTGSIAVEK